ncbi:hypothetical protein [Maledivibacter halophilus]|uniref:Uncharacterized protein n=1 Tax=Maledivibacter halophilus TaxID=36842 RepID=A0A1T5MQW3_9FIRM|nr:hypothetical protein [Maledivibacter halophilus]SKC90592.1 hypothetical protein SAMN02194393_05192 [Maledivibacter halophilus]
MNIIIGLFSGVGIIILLILIIPILLGILATLMIPKFVERRKKLERDKAELYMNTINNKELSEDNFFRKRNNQ